MRCPACQADVLDAQRFCGACGSALVQASRMSTAAVLSRPGAHLAAPDSLEPGRTAGDSRGFTPGTVLAGRYRIVGLVGRGGMGEVYRADDLRLGTPVALKFLPRGLASDPNRRERLLTEVRIARTVTHPSVCRVFDIGETADNGGLCFITMEYVDGEDLASLLRRIGRLPADKALEIARQICAGLAAAHDRHVIHRDLKPANVMIDGRGRVRITDFGLAVGTDAATRDADASGTPAYMAPEQLAGEPASVRSDVYALGLVLYELYTGRHAFDAASLAPWHERKTQALPPAPSTIIRDMEPAVERAIMRAIAPDPRTRPASVAEVAAALPGGNAIDAALRAGETPSPDMVAASGSMAGLAPMAAWAAVAVIVFGAGLAIAVGARVMLWRSAALAQPPEALAARARQVLASAGRPDLPVDRAFGFEADVEYLRYLRVHDRSRTRWNRQTPNFFRFWYRESPQPLESWRFVFSYGNLSRIDPSDPPLDVAGMSLVRLEPSGRLVELVVVPPATAADQNRIQPPDWPAFLTAAGYDGAAWTPVPPQLTPRVYADDRAAWEGTWPGRPDLPVRLEAGSFHGAPVYFSAVFPWSRPEHGTATALTSGDRAALVPLFLALAAMIGGGAIVAQRNARAGHGDRRGALRLSAFVFVAMFVSWFFGESHVATLWEVALVAMALAWALLAACICWVAYLAIEPFLRRRWPDVMITWTRLLAGDAHDPLVGRDVLIGCAGGTILAVMELTSPLVPSWFGLAPDLVPADIVGVAYNVPRVGAVLVWRLAQSVGVGLGALFLLLLVRRVLASEWASMSAFVVISAVPAVISYEYPWIGFAVSAALSAAFVALLRIGLLVAVVAFYTSGLFIMFPVTADLQAWYASAGVAALLVVTALAVFGFTRAVRPSRPGRAAAGG